MNMGVRKDASGKRSVQAEVNVPGTPEQVWQAIATGPGVSSWFVPCDIEGREGGATICHFGPGDSMDSIAKVTEWEPPRRFVAESQDMGPDSPVVATEWIVEAQAGGSCIVRVVHSWFAETDDWDAQFEGAEQGWAAFFRNLRLYLTYFPGQASSAFQLMGASAEPTAEVWGALTAALGVTGATVDQRIRTADGAPLLAGTVERAGEPPWPELLVRLDEPAPGIAHLFALPMGGMTYLPIRLYLFGDQAAQAAASGEPAWESWMSDRFPVGAPPECGD
jgi:uncharacterized protein YndB with AHSA1/START domain